MSAQPQTPEGLPVREDHGRSRLRLLTTPRAVLSPVGFGIVIAGLVVLGLGLVMVVSTSVAAQSRQLASLRKEATALEYTAAALTTQLQARSSTSALALRASDLGMVPNPYPAFIRLSDGAILGDPKPVTGSETSYLRGASQVPVPSPFVAAQPQPDMPADQAAAAEATQEVLPGLPTTPAQQTQEATQ